ncbi:MAG: hypothetical protein M3R15_32625, partial [Acidobacteriota bacterium]|nr:hypothetical protein [Acidobacteriota bacterium]
SSSLPLLLWWKAHRFSNLLSNVKWSVFLLHTKGRQCSLGRRTPSAFYLVCLTCVFRGSVSKVFGAIGSSALLVQSALNRYKWRHGRNNFAG